MINAVQEISKSRLGGLRRIALYGNPGTAEGRSKGGRRTISLFHSDPVFARKSGFVIRKEIRYPKRSVKLAELIGIMLGDGGLPSKHQLTITFNNKTDKKYSTYLKRLFKELFVVDCYVRYRKDNNGADIIVSSSNLIEFLLRQGLIPGNKVKNQVGIPDWIDKNIEYSKACLRGLIDTDGSFYHHRYSSGAKEYNYLKLCFTNCSKPLLNSVLMILRRLKFKAYLHGNNVLIYSVSDVKRYFGEIGTNNPKHQNKFKQFYGG